MGSGETKQPNGDHETTMVAPKTAFFDSQSTTFEGKKLVFLGFERRTELFGPTPENIQTQKFGFVLFFSCLRSTVATKSQPNGPAEVQRDLFNPISGRII